jgi:sarcosine oxidase subunit gamma
MNAHATPPWGVEPTGMRGAAHATPTVNVAWLRSARCITITPFREQQAACAAWLAQNFDLAWPKAGRIVVKGDLAAAWNGPGDIMLIDAKGNVSIDQILSALAGKAAIVDQSSGRIVIRLAGEKARRTLMKLVDIDIDPTVFKPGMGGITALHHMSVGVFKIADEPIFWLHAARTYASDVWHSLAEAGEEFSIDMQVLDKG